MPIISKEDFKNKTIQKKSILSIDYGEKRIGIAISNPECSIALPSEVLERKKKIIDINHIKTIIEQKKIQALLVGMPYNMDGSESVNCQSVKDFINNLLKIINIDIIFWDERLSTVAQEKILINNNVSRKKRKKVIDKIVASGLLQDFLDYLKN
tara:strand:- start:38 stop:499 length:462 start_codon:yes stop_codon:yes gene_type:complete